MDQQGISRNPVVAFTTTIPQWRLQSGVAETGTALVTTVADNASNYTHADYSRALLARKTQQIIG